MNTKKIDEAFKKVAELNELIGNEASFWEMGFIARYVKFQEDENSTMTTAQHVEQGRKLMRSMLDMGLIVDRTDKILKKISLGENPISKKGNILNDFINYIGSDIVDNDKNDGNYVVSMACGDTSLNGTLYEIRIVFEPRKEKWFGKEGKVDYVKIQKEK